MTAFQDVYDVVVVGGRTIGSNVAAGFAEQGYDTLLIERNDTVGEPLACSGHYSRDLWDHVPDDATDLVQNEIRGARFHTGDHTYRYHHDETVSWVVDRVGLDQRMFEHAAECGADTATRCRLRDWEGRDDGYRLLIDDGDDERYANTSIVAGCDGAGSTVRQLAGIDRPDTFLTGLMAFTDEQDGQDFVDVYLDVPGFFAWRIPRGDGVEYGVAVVQDHDVQDELDRHLDEHAPHDPGNRYAGTIPMHPPDRVTRNRAFLVGDAAGQTKPFTGGGIVYGLRCGNIAAGTIDPDDPDTFDRYENTWRDALGTDIRLGEWIRKAYDLPGPVKHPLMRLLEGDISGIHMDRPTTLLFRE